MFTFGFSWRPWPGDRALADGPSILDYLRTVAEEYGVDELIRYRHRVAGASWDSATALWTVEVDHDGDADHAHRRLPVGLLAATTTTTSRTRRSSRAPTSFAGPIVHPQHWPEDLDYAGKKVVVIGSGATAVTLVPALAGTAGHVTMLQRSPSYILEPAGPRPARDRAGQAADQAVLPGRPLGQHPAHRRLLPARRAAGPSLVKRLDPQGASRRSCPTASTSTCTSSRATTRGTSGSASSRTATCSAPCARARPRSSPTRSRRFTPTRHPADVGRGARGRHHRHRDRAADPGLRRPRPGRGRRAGRLLDDDGLQGADAQRRPQLRLHGRLHQRVVDAQGRPGLDVRRPAARAPGPDRRPVGGAGPAAGRRGDPVHGLHVRLRAARPRPAAQAGRPGAVAAQAELPDRPAHHQARPHRRRGAGLRRVPRRAGDPALTGV